MLADPSPNTTVSEPAGGGPAPLRLALVGGGPGSFIGPVHRMAAELDGHMRLVAGAFSRDPARTKEAGRTLGVQPERAYLSVAALLCEEAARSDGAEIVAIATPNASHMEIALAALESGMAVISDKPAAATLTEAMRIRSAVRRTGGLYALTYTYTGYAMVREARSIIASGALGSVRKAVVEYPQGWLSERVEDTGSRQALWRTDPAQAGAGGCIGDIGVHAFNALEFVTGQRVATLLADVSTVVAGRALDDDVNVLLRLESGAPAVLHASQIASGARNGLRLRVWGERGGLEWRHESPGELTIDWLTGRTEVRHAGDTSLSPGALRATRLPPGHPEGFIEAFATIYSDFAAAVRAGSLAARPLLQSVEDGVRGHLFIETALRSSGAQRWHKLEDAGEVAS